MHVVTIHISHARTHLADAVPTTRWVPCRSMKHLICHCCDTFWKPELCSLSIKSPIGPQSTASETPSDRDSKRSSSRSIIERQTRPHLLLGSTRSQKSVPSQDESRADVHIIRSSTAMTTFASHREHVVLLSLPSQAEEQSKTIRNFSLMLISKNQCHNCRDHGPDLTSTRPRILA